MTTRNGGVETTIDWGKK